MNTVYWRTDERGFTLIEMLLALSISLLIMLLLPSLVKTIGSGHEIGRDFSRDVSLFFNHLSCDVREAQTVETGVNMLFIDKGSRGRYSIELTSSNQLRRTLNRAGHVLLLEDVHSLHCQLSGQMVLCEVELLNGQRESRSMFIPHPITREEG